MVGSTLDSRVLANGRLDTSVDTPIREQVHVIVPTPLDIFDLLTLYVGRRVYASAEEVNRLRAKVNLQPKSEPDFAALYSPISDIGGHRRSYSRVWQLLTAADGVSDISKDVFDGWQGEYKRIPPVILRAPQKILADAEKALPELIKCETQFLNRTKARSIPSLGIEFHHPSDWRSYLILARTEIAGYRSLLSSIKEASETAGKPPVESARS